MSINTQLETRHEESLIELPDPRGHVNWLLSLANLETSVCLKFIDPYGDTVFNTLQLPALLCELEAIAPLVTETNLLAAKIQYLDGTITWPALARDDARTQVESLSVDDLQGHLNSLLELVKDALRRGPHHYCRFVGD